VARGAGDDQTDRQARTLAEAISYPRQADATGYTRALLATTLGRSGGVQVLEATDLQKSESRRLGCIL